MSDKKPLCNYAGVTKEMISGDQVIGHRTYLGIESIGDVTFDNSTHVLSVASVTYWHKGTQYTTASPVTCDLDLIADRDHVSATLTANTLYYFYFKDATGKIYWSPDMFNLNETAPVATVFWNGTTGAVSKEHHGYKRNIDWHIWAHLTIGARYASGLGLTYPSTSVDGSLQLESGSIYDEDILTSISQQTTMRGYYRVSAGVYTFADYSLPYLGTAGAPVYLDTDTYALTTFAANKYACYWVFATNDKDRPISIIPSHVSSPYSQVTEARSETQPAISGVNPDWKLIYRFIYAGDGQFQESTDYRLQTSIAGGVSAASNASAVAFSPSGNVAATNVQSAIEELDTEKSATSHTHSDATTSVSGFMSATDKTKLDGVATGATAYTDALARSAVIASSISDGDTTHAPDGNSVFDALALKAPLLSPSFTTPALGTPSSGTLTNCTGLPQAGVTGLTTTDSPVFGTVKLSNLTDGYLPKHTSDAVGLVNSPIYTDGTDVDISGAKVTLSKYSGTLPTAITGTVLHVSEASGVSTRFLIDGFGTQPIITGRTAKIVDNALSALNAGSTLLQIGTFGYGATGYSSSSKSSIFFQASENWTDSANGTQIYLTTTTNLSTTAVERLRITNDGLIGISTTSPASKLSVSGNLSVGANYAAVAAPSNGAIFEGDVGIKNSSPSAALDIDSDILRLRTAKTPASASAAGNAGDICWDSSFLYICISDATWRRIAHATWT